MWWSLKRGVDMMEEFVFVVLFYSSLVWTLPCSTIDSLCHPPFSFIPPPSHPPPPRFSPPSPSSPSPSSPSPSSPSSPSSSSPSPSSPSRSSLLARKHLVDFNDPISKRRGYRKLLKDQPIHRIYNRSLPYLRTLARPLIDQMVVDVRHEQWLNRIRLNGRHEDYSKVYERDLRSLLSKLYLVATEQHRGVNMPRATAHEVAQEEQRIRLVARSEQEGRAREGNGGVGNHFGRSGFIGGRTAGQFGPGPAGYFVDLHAVEEERRKEVDNQWFYGGSGKKHFY
eukprot:GHVS01032048.1.p1 GENE.GHVS01032048.1~~GHVS01032048.1.p1  ORF type:complete len:282 (-),score=105.25 GHVS01032048.1:191-1036(-)